MTDYALEIEGVSKAYPIFAGPGQRFVSVMLRRSPPALAWALRDIDLKVRRGETVGIVGRNGSGKSTLLKLIHGVLEPTSGRVKVNGRSSAILELGTGFNPLFTGRENVQFSTMLHGMSSRETAQRMEEILAFADIGDYIDQPVQTYSTGMQARLAFAVSICVDAEILIVDEALAVGDERFQRKCFARIEELRSQGTTILFVSHSAGQLLELCSRVVLIDRGRRLVTADPTTAVRLYQRLIYAPDSEREAVVRDALLADRADADARQLATAPDVPQTTIDAPATAEGGAGYHDPSLVPTTTTAYPELGARIHEIVLRDGGGRAVNNLRQREVYFLRYRVSFSEVCFGVHFGMHLRSVTGQIVGGLRWPSVGHPVQQIAAGTEMEIEFPLLVRLSPGTYFLSAGVWAEMDEPCRHRIIDALMVRVLETPGSHAFGIADLGTESPVGRVISESPSRQSRQLAGSRT